MLALGILPEPLHLFFQRLDASSSRTRSDPLVISRARAIPVSSFWSFRLQSPETVCVSHEGGEGKEVRINGVSWSFLIPMR